jgi:thioredoxin reductase (NADPH)
MILALRLQLGPDFPVVIVDVDSDPALELRYGERVPLLMDGETELCCYRYDPVKLAAYASEIR